MLLKYPGGAYHANVAATYTAALAATLALIALGKGDLRQAAKDIVGFLEPLQ